MRFSRSASASDDFEINVIPLIDVMLTLLMFFVMTATFEKRALMQVKLPEASAEVMPVEQKVLTLIIDAKGAPISAPTKSSMPTWRRSRTR